MPSFKPADVDSAQPFARDETKSGDQSDPLVNGMAISQIKSMNIKTVQIEKTRTITPYDSQVLRESVQSASYSAWKRTFVNPHHQKNSRFQLNELAKANMSVEQEEELRIETEVQKRVFERLKELTEIGRAHV